jgi:sarcosine oxidase
MGAAACCHLAKRGVRVVGFEQFGRGHQFGSSHGHSRVVRQAYHEHPDYVPLLKRSFELWAAMPADILHRCGALFVGAPDSAICRGALAAAAAHAIPVEALDHAELALRYPQFAFGEDHVGVFEPGAGFVVPERGIEWHLEEAEAAGADIRQETQVAAIESTDGGVLVRTDRGTVKAAQVVVTAGAWTERFVSFPACPLEVQRKAIVWFEPVDTALCDQAAMPTWIINSGDAQSAGDYYGVPTWHGQPGPQGVKVGFHGPGPPVDPDTVDRVVSPETIATFERDVHGFLPDVVGSAVESAVCLYTMSADGHFIIERAPASERIIVACGFSGHGYKFAPVIGEVLADLAIDGVSRHDIVFLGLGNERV